MFIDVDLAIKELQNNKPIIIFDKENENEGDIIYPSEIITEEILTFMLNECKGVICVTLEKDVLDNFEIPIIKKRGRSITGQTNFALPVDHVNSETGISSKDRKMIIDELLSGRGQKDNLVIPGHQNLLKISTNGLLDRQGHTESSSELIELAGYKRSATICEIIDPNGVPMREDAICEFGKKHNIKVILLSEIYNKFIKNAVIFPELTVCKNPYDLLYNKQIVMTGGNSGIGKSLKNKLSNFQCNIIDFSKSKGFDITDYDKINEYIKNNIGDVDILINCAGYIEAQSIESMNLDIWNKHINTNLTGVFNITKNIIPKFKKGGHILTITSPSAKKIRENWSAYCCTKAALNSFTLNCSQELKAKNIMVNGVSPTKTNTPMIHRLFPTIDNNKLIEPEIISNYMINILCDSIKNKTTGIIYDIKN
jgi:3,4-dihydroxy-2-butanone 4-phosphate synthase